MEIRKLTGARLVCVGDDWQSIYRFAGSDISLFSNFGKYAGKYEQLLIEQTYRNSQPLIDISSTFIQKNPRQISKYPKSKKEPLRSEEHTSELQSLMRISYAVFCLKNKKYKIKNIKQK